MAKKIKNRLPTWSYEDNPLSSFGLVTADLLRSKRYQGLSNPAKILLTVLIVHAKTKESQECCFNRLQEIFIATGQDKAGAKFDAGRLVHTEGKAFVFPRVHYEKYGYERKTVCKYMKELRDDGFIELMYSGKNQYLVNVYSFSEKWKS